MITDNSTGGTDTVYNHFYADSNNNKKKSDREFIKLADSSILAVNYNSQSYKCGFQIEKAG